MNTGAKTCETDDVGGGSGTLVCNQRLSLKRSNTPSQIPVGIRGLTGFNACKAYGEACTTYDADYYEYFGTQGHRDFESDCSQVVPTSFSIRGPHTSQRYGSFHLVCCKVA